MFSRLPESNRRRQRTPGGLFISTVCHLVIIALAVRATGLRAAPGPKEDPLPPPIYVERPVDPIPAPASSRRPIESGTVVPPMPATPVIPVTIGVDIPDGIPAPGSMNVEGLFARTTVAQPDGAPSGSPNVSDASPLTESMVEKAVIALPGLEPRYPPMLQSAGVEGDVRTQFVVDTLGRVEKGSVNVLSTSHDLFSAAVRDALNRARFKPAEVGGRHVRQLVEQTFTFRIR
jgi:protein TonB